MSVVSDASTSSNNNAAMGSEDINDVNLIESCNEENLCKIEILNDDCLAHIFTFLPRRQLIRIERVCKRWQDVSLKFWSIVKKVSSDDVIEGPYAYTKDMWGYLLHTVKYCTALRFLKVKYVHSLEEVVFSDSLMKLEELILVGCGANDTSFQHFFIICPNITALTATNLPSITGKGLEGPNMQYMKTLTLDLAQGSCMDSLITSFGRMVNLKSLTITVHICQKVNSEQFRQLFKNLPNVEHLAFSNCKQDPITNTGTNSYTVPKKLVSLDLHDNSFVNDALIKDVSENCVNLESLNISGWCNVTDVGIRMLVNLHHLKNLSLGQIKEYYYIDDYVTDRELELLASRRKLVKLEIRYNSKITDIGCAKILSLCEELEHLNLRGCSNITNATVMSAETAVLHRTNNKKLELLLNGTRVYPFKEDWKHLTPSLILDFKFDYQYLM